MNGRAPDSIWQGVYASFAEAAGDESVFDGERWLASVRSRLAKDRRTSAETGSISPLASTRDYVLPVVAAMLAAANDRVRILDFGGGLASMYLSCVASLPHGVELDWTVVETETVCEAGRKDLAEFPGISFCETLPPAGKPFDIVHAGSSMHYIDDWKEILRKLAEYGARMVLFSDLTAGDIPTFISTQNYYGRRIPVRFWNFDEFRAAVEATGYQLIYKSLFKAVIAGLEQPLPNSALPETHRLQHTCHLLFEKS